MKKEKSKLVQTIGVNDANYTVTNKVTIGYINGKQKQKLSWICPFYSRWKRMLERCYSSKHHERHPTYIGCTVCEEWLTFSNFKAWMETQDWEGKELDKDILVIGNKVYSPETCAFVTAEINSFVLESTTSRGKYSLGVHWDIRRNKFVSQCRNPFTKKTEFLGYFNTEQEAHKAWLERKLWHAISLSKTINDPNVAKALVSRYTYYVENTGGAV